MNIQVDPTSSNLASAMLNSKIRPHAVVGYGVKIFHPSPPNYVTRSPGISTTGPAQNEEGVSPTCVCNVQVLKFASYSSWFSSHFPEIFAKVLLLCLQLVTVYFFRRMMMLEVTKARTRKNSFYQDLKLRTKCTYRNLMNTNEFIINMFSLNR